MDSSTKSKATQFVFILYSGNMFLFYKFTKHLSLTVVAIFVMLLKFSELILTYCIALRLTPTIRYSRLNTRMSFTTNKYKLYCINHDSGKVLVLYSQTVVFLTTVGRKTTYF